MKKITCEICESTDLVKQDGVFVCQNCGCKYSVEDIKKMMNAEISNISDTATVDRTLQIENIMKNADITFASANYIEAVKLYSEAMNIDPENPHAIMYRAISSAWQSTVNNCRIVEIDRAAKKALSLKHMQVGDSKEYFDFCADATLKIAHLLNAISQMYINFYNKAKPTPLTLTGAVATSRVSLSVQNTMEAGTNNCCTVNRNIVTYALENVQDFRFSTDAYWNILEQMMKNNQVYRKNARMESTAEDQYMIDHISQIYSEAKPDIDKERESAKQGYWAEHPEEREQLESKKNLAVKRRDALAQQENEHPHIVEQRQLETAILQLEHEIKSLGIFKIKEKKTKQSEIESLKRRKVEIDDAANLLTTNIRKEIQEINAEIDAIDIELNKDRR